MCCLKIIITTKTRYNEPRGHPGRGEGEKKLAEGGSQVPGGKISI